MSHYEKTNLLMHRNDLSLTDVPVVHLELGSKLQVALIKEGDDVYMECHIDSHPRITKVTWMHNVSYYSLIWKIFHQ